MAHGVPAAHPAHAANAAWLAPGIVTDRSDPKLAHIDGLNLSRAWMLEGHRIGPAEDDPRTAALRPPPTRMPPPRCPR